MSLSNTQMRILVATVQEATIAAICRQFGVNNLGELAQKIESQDRALANINRDLATMVDTKVTAAVNAPATIKAISVAVTREQRQFRDEMAQDRREQFRQILAEQTGAEPGTLDTLVERADEARLAQGKSATEWPATIATWLSLQYGAMEVALGTLVNKNKLRTSDVDLAAHAKYLIVRGLNPDDPAAVRRALEADSNFEGLLKKA